jgi:hypothetical protein
MFHAALLVEQRRHPRAQLHLPVRLRWLGPFGYRLEVSRSLDASRGGLLLCLPEACGEGARLWVTFPFDSATTSAQPETPARVVRVELASLSSFLIALEFESSTSYFSHPVESERRASARVPLALPLTARESSSPWPEQTMTTDISEGGMRFETSRLYSAGETVLLELRHGKWASKGEMPSRVVRIEAVPGAFEQRAAVEFKRQGKSLSAGGTSA